MSCNMSSPFIHFTTAWQGRMNLYQNFCIWKKYARGTGHEYHFWRLVTLVIKYPTKALVTMFYFIIFNTSHGYERSTTVRDVSNTDTKQPRHFKTHGYRTSFTVMRAWSRIFNGHTVTRRRPLNFLIIKKMKYNLNIICRCISISVISLLTPSSITFPL